MLHIIIDGYNYINRIGGTQSHDRSDPDMLRRYFLERFYQYKRYKKAKMTVVFDAYRSYSTGRHTENYKGINVVYSREHETADDIIIEWIRQKRQGIVVVTSDREIIDEAKRYGIAFVTPVRLEESMAEYDNQGDEEVAEQKKGNPHRLPKRLRKALKGIDKI